MGSKVKYLDLARVNCQYLLLKFRRQTEVQYIWNISNGILDRRPGSNRLDGLRGWAKGQNSTFSRYGHVAYQIKGNDTCSNMVASTLPAAPTWPWGRGQKVKFYLLTTWSCCISSQRVSQMQHGSSYFACRHPDPGVGLNGQTFDFFRIWSCCISN